MNLAKDLGRRQPGRQVPRCMVGLSLPRVEGLFWALVQVDGHTWALGLLMGPAAPLTRKRPHNKTKKAFVIRSGCRPQRMPEGSGWGRQLCRGWGGAAADLGNVVLLQSMGWGLGWCQHWVPIVVATDEPVSASWTTTTKWHRRGGPNHRNPSSCDLEAGHSGSSCLQVGATPVLPSPAPRVLPVHVSKLSLSI